MTQPLLTVVIAVVVSVAAFVRSITVNLTQHTGSDGSGHRRENRETVAWF